MIDFELTFREVIPIIETNADDIRKVHVENIIKNSNNKYDTAHKINAYKEAHRRDFRKNTSLLFNRMLIFVKAALSGDTKTLREFIREEEDGKLTSNEMRVKFQAFASIEDDLYLAISSADSFLHTHRRELVQLVLKNLTDFKTKQTAEQRIIYRQLLLLTSGSEQTRLWKS